MLRALFYETKKSPFKSFTLYTRISVSEQVRIKFLRIRNHLRGSRYPNLDKGYKSSDTEAPQYPNRGGGLSASESTKGVLVSEFG